MAPRHAASSAMLLQFCSYQLVLVDGFIPLQGLSLLKISFANVFNNQKPYNRTR